MRQVKLFLTSKFAMGFEADESLSHRDHRRLMRRFHVRQGGPHLSYLCPRNAISYALIRRTSSDIARLRSAADDSTGLAGKGRTVSGSGCSARNRE